MIRLLIALLTLTGCWYHRVEVPSSVTYASEERFTLWATGWRAAKIDAGDECPSQTIKQVTVRGNWGYSLIRLATLGLVAPTRVERHCARARIDDANTPPDTGAITGPDGATYWSIGLGKLMQYEPTPQCRGRGLDTVAVRPNPLFDLMSVGTVGLVSPLRIGWKCRPLSTGAP